MPAVPQNQGPRFGRNSLFFWIVFAFLLAIVPVYVVAMALNESGSRSVKKEISSSMQSRARFFMGTLEQELGNTVLLMNNLSQDSDFQKLGTIAPALGRTEYFQAVERVQGKMRLLQSSNPYITSAEVYIPQIEKTIRGTTYVEPMAEKQIEAIRRKSASYLFTFEDKLQMGLVYPEYGSSGKSPNFAILVTLDRYRVQEAMKQAVGGSGGAVLTGNMIPWSVSESSEPAAAEIGDKLMGQIQAGSRDLKELSGKVMPVKVSGTRYWVSAQPSDKLDAMLVLYAPERQFLQSLGMYRFIFTGLSIFSLLIVLAFSVWIYNRIHQPLNRLVRAFRRLNIENLQQVELHHGHPDEFHYLYEHFNEMVKRMQMLIQEVYKQKIHAQRSELKQLQSQINPHFLYNSFFTLHQMAEMWDIDNLVLFTRHLGEYFRFITRSASDEVKLQSEIQHAQSYTSIQTIRFHSWITVEWDPIPPGWSNRTLPLLTLQPLIENAYEHGLKSKQGDGRIEIRMTAEVDGLRLSIEDNGDALTDKQLSGLKDKLRGPEMEGEEVTGLVNVHRRLQLMFGGQSGLQLTRGLLGGLRIEIILPLEEETQDVPVADRG
ncbi:histidine kinase [Paenibacillus yonginensis]|uniref:Histidine kinase n=1 Tax=Paenibacillus yonginensis TaxID=1462996 RepID=A0A1B1N6J4_9BACL|nr:histidine kinase [Paenibacillus yonginensis]